jgi:hypothetical protein
MSAAHRQSLFVGENCPHIGLPLRLGLAVGDVALQTSRAMKRKRSGVSFTSFWKMNWKPWTKTKTSIPDDPDDQNEYTRESHYVWRDGHAKRPLLVALYRGHPQPNPPLPDCEYKNLIVAGAKHWELPTDYIRELESIQTG